MAEFWDLGRSWVSLFQGVVIAGFGFVVAITLPKYYNPSLVTSIGFVTPVSGVLLAMWLLGDPLTWQLIVGTLDSGSWALSHRARTLKRLYA